MSLNNEYILVSSIFVVTKSILHQYNLQRSVRWHLEWVPSNCTPGGFGYRQRYRLKQFWDDHRHISGFHGCATYSILSTKTPSDVATPAKIIYRYRRIGWRSHRPEWIPKNHCGQTRHQTRNAISSRETSFSNCSKQYVNLEEGGARITRGVTSSGCCTGSSTCQNRFLQNQHGRVGKYNNRWLPYC